MGHRCLQDKIGCFSLELSSYRNFPLNHAMVRLYCVAFVVTIQITFIPTQKVITAH